MHRVHPDIGLKDPVQIQYREFYDFPRMFVVRHRGVQYLFDGSFDDELDDYPEEYEVFLLPSLTPEQLSGSWALLPRAATRSLGTVPTSAVSFDTSRRQWIDAAVFNQLADTR